MKKQCEEKNINPKKEYAKKYLLKYIKDLKVHFDLEDAEVRDIIKHAYCKNSLCCFLIEKIGKFFK